MKTFLGSACSCTIHVHVHNNVCTCIYMYFCFGILINLFLFSEIVRSTKQHAIFVYYVFLVHDCIMGTIVHVVLG